MRQLLVALIAFQGIHSSALTVNSYDNVSDSKLVARPDPHSANFIDGQTPSRAVVSAITFLKEKHPERKCKIYKVDAFVLERSENPVAYKVLYRVYFESGAWRYIVPIYPNGKIANHEMYSNNVLLGSSP